MALPTSKLFSPSIFYPIAYSEESRFSDQLNKVQSYVCTHAIASDCNGFFVFWLLLCPEEFLRWFLSSPEVCWPNLNIFSFLNTMATNTWPLRICAHTSDVFILFLSFFFSLSLFLSVFLLLLLLLLLFETHSLYYVVLDVLKLTI